MGRSCKNSLKPIHWFHKKMQKLLRSSRRHVCPGPRGENGSVRGLRWLRWLRWLRHRATADDFQETPDLPAAAGTAGTRGRDDDPIWRTDFHIFQKGRYTTNQIMIVGSIWDKLIEVGVCQFMVSYCYGSNMYKILAFGDTHKTPHMLVYFKSEMHVVSRYPYCWMMGTHHDPIISRYHCLFLWCNITMENHHFLWVNPL